MTQRRVTHKVYPKQGKMGSRELVKMVVPRSERLFMLDPKLESMKHTIRSSIDPDILNRKKANWNPSSSTVPPPRKDQEKHLFNAWPRLTV